MINVGIIGTGEISVAIIGTGGISAAHIRAYKTFPEKCRIVALCDIYPEKCEAAIKAFELGEDVKVFADYKELLKEPGIQLVSICTPPYVHASIAIDALHAGKNVVCEKPMAASLEECDKMIAAEKETGLMLACIAQNRFRNDYMALKKILDTGVLGRVCHAEVNSYWRRGLSYYDLWWRGTWEKEGGGCTLNHAVHHIDMLLWLMGAPERVTAVLSNADHENSEVEDVSAAILEYPHGSIAQITSSVIHHGQEQLICLQGEDASIAAPWSVHASSYYPNGFPYENKELEEKIQKMHDELPPLEHELHPGEIGNVLDALIKGEKPLITSRDGRRTIELITAIYKAGTERRPVELPLKPDDPYYTVEGIMSHVRHFYEKRKSIENVSDGPEIQVDYRDKEKK